MNDADLNRMLKRAATAATFAPPSSLESAVMARVRVDDGRAKRWRAFVRGLLIAAAVAAVVTAGMIGFALAMQDKTHTTPPVMNLFREGRP